MKRSLSWVLYGSLMIVIVVFTACFLSLMPLDRIIYELGRMAQSTGEALDDAARAEGSWSNCDYLSTDTSFAYLDGCASMYYLTVCNMSKDRNMTFRYGHKACNGLPIQWHSCTLTPGQEQVFTVMNLCASSKGTARVYVQPGMYQDQFCYTAKVVWGDPCATK